MPLTITVIDDQSALRRDPNYVVTAAGGVVARAPVAPTVNTAAQTVPADKATILVHAARVPSQAVVFAASEALIAQLEAQFGPATVTAHPAVLPAVAGWVAGL